MTKPSDLLDEDSIKDIAKNTIKAGDVFRIKMDKTNGITPKKGDYSRNKFFIVLGFDSDGYIWRSNHKFQHKPMCSTIHKRFANAHKML